MLTRGRLRLATPLAAIEIAAIALALVSCRGEMLGAGEDRDKVHVGIVFDIGGKDDRSFNAAAWEGVKRAAEDLPIVLRDVEPGDPTSIEPAMRAFAERGYDLIIGVGFLMADAVGAVAKQFPDTNFAIIDFSASELAGTPANVRGLL
ncbi:MAG TPA: BMP family ABC transporter substrate-binding protein, partial [Thermoanaerobaculia bacterium]|nr:BMP family ABC transporter substrate-binding protein [Thermoanaerobaculia bacterium]